MLPPKLADKNNMDKIEHDKMEYLSLFSSFTVSEKASTFLAYAVKSSSLAEVRRKYRKVLSLYLNADHIVCAYITRQNQGFQDDAKYWAELD